MCDNCGSTLHGATVESVTNILTTIEGSGSQLGNHGGSAKRSPTHHELLLLLLHLLCLLNLTDRTGEAILNALSQVFELVEIIAHLLLALELSGHHARLQLLLLLKGARLAGFSSLFEKAETV